MTVTFDRGAARFVLEAIGFRPGKERCHSCGGKMRIRNVGAILKLDDGVAYWHNRLPCLLDLLKQKGAKR